MSTSAGSQNQAGQKLFNFRTRRTSGTNGRLLTLFTVGGQECAATQLGGWKGWFVDEPGRTWAVVNGTQTDLAHRMWQSLFEAPILAEVTLIGRKPNGQQRIIDDLLQAIIDRAANGKPSKHERRRKFKQLIVNEVVIKAHLGILTNEDLFLLINMERPVPPSAPIDQRTECRNITNALTSTHHEVKGLWASTPSRFRWATDRQYDISEGPNGRVIVRNGKDGPKLTVGSINRQKGQWAIAALGLRTAIRRFVEEVHPDLPAVVKPVAEEKVPY